MVEIVTILLAFISILVSAIAGILSYMLYHFIPMKQKVETLWNSWFGVPDTADTGHLAHFQSQHEEIEDRHKDIREVVEETREENADAHREVRRSFTDVFQYLNKLALELRSEDINVTPPDEELDDDDFYRGGDNDD